MSVMTDDAETGVMHTARVLYREAQQVARILSAEGITAEEAEVLTNAMIGPEILAAMRGLEAGA